MASRASASVGSGWSSRNAVIVVTKPGVQKPHCSAWHSWKACCTGPSSPSGSRQPSVVVIAAPSTDTANIRQRPHRRAVDQHGAGAADAVLAADVGAGEPDVVPDRVGQQPAGRHRHRVRHAVDDQRDVVQGARSRQPTLPGRAVAVQPSASARAVSTRARWRAVLGAGVDVALGLDRRVDQVERVVPAPRRRRRATASVTSTTTGVARH